MDTITHGIVGALIGKTFFADQQAPAKFQWREAPVSGSRVAIVSATLGAIFPDIDVFADPFARDGLGMMTVHRSLTHSIVLLPLWAIVLTVLTRWLARRLGWAAPKLRVLFGIYAAGIASHIFLDVITSFGTMIWSPISYARVSWDWVFIIDLTVTGMALVPQLAAWAFRRKDRALNRALPLWVLLAGVAFAVGPIVRPLGVPYPLIAPAAVSLVLAIFLVLPLRNMAGTRLQRARWCSVGAALLAAYLTFAGALHHSALQRIDDFVEAAHLQVQSTAALPLPPSPARWAGLIATTGGSYRVQFNQLADEPPKIDFFPQPPDNRYLEAARGLRDVQVFLWFARFPVFQYSDRGGQPMVRISDLPFLGLPGGLPGAQRPRDAAPGTAPTSAFTYQVVFTEAGQVVSAGLLPR